MPKFPTFSGEELIHILEQMGCTSRPGKGDHVTIKREYGNDEIGASVPLHDTLDTGTVFGILRRLKITKQELLRKREEMK